MDSNNVYALMAVVAYGVLTAATATRAADNPPYAAPPIAIDASLRSCVAVTPPAHGVSRQDAPTEITADTAQTEADKKTILSGNVSISRADQLLQADKVTLDEQTNQAVVSGDKAVYTDHQAHIAARQAQLDFNDDAHNFTAADFTMLHRYARGAAKEIQTQQGREMKLYDATYTTCPPASAAWWLEARQITLNNDSGRGAALDTKIKFFGVPILYSPYLSFPIDNRRQSGWLTPRLSRSNDRGAELVTPFYFNIAPNRDATLYPRYMSKRGLQLGGEYRYLHHRNRGQLNLEYLADDSAFTLRDDNDRWGFQYRHSGSIFSGWSMDAKVHRVSDEYYFEDMSDRVTLSGQTHLNNYLRLGKNGDRWSFYGLLQQYQTVDRIIDDADKPYERAPYMAFNYHTAPFAKHFSAGVTAAYTNFKHKDNVVGKRFSFYPSVTYDYDAGGYYVRPKLGVHYTRYRLERRDALPSDVERTAPIFSVDGGLFYERQTSLFGRGVWQTLEPRFYYLNAPEDDQRNIPNFDTDQFDFGTSSLFRENRFSGVDRIGDANQLSIGVTSRFFGDDDGAEKLAATLGQIYYFSDRNVTLPGDTPDTGKTSPMIAELRYRPSRELTAGALIHWDADKGATERISYHTRYQPQPDKILNIAYRFRKDALRQTDLSFLWPLDKQKRWRLIGRRNYSLLNNKALNTFAGVEYESCCWKIRLAARRRTTDAGANAGDDYDTGIFMELQLKGLGSVGDDVADLLDYDYRIDEQNDDTYYY